MSVVLSSFDLLKGKTSKWDKYNRLVSPIQMIPKKEKDEDWKQANLDWYEHIGIMQLRQKSRKYFKWYNMAEGIIDKKDYIKDVDNDFNDIIEVISSSIDSDFDIKFYPIIPNIVDVMVGEFAKRSNKVIVKSIDEYAINEMLEKKKEMVTNTLVARAQARIAQNLAAQGIALESEEAIQEMQNAPSLPEIQRFFNKSYRGIAEEWATHELADAEERFKMYELESIGFRDSLITDEEFWHVRLTENDYAVELWNPVNTFYHKSPEVRYVSEGNYVGRINLMSISDVIDRFGYLMTIDQIKSLEKVITPRADFGRMAGSDATSTDYWNTNRKPGDQIQSIHWNQAMAMKSNFDDNIGFMDWLNRESDVFNTGMVRVVEVYWKSQKKIAHLKQINDLGEVFEDVVTEEFVVTEKPVYDLTLSKNKTKENLIYGQHLDYIWVNEVWKGTKIGLNYFNGWMDDHSGFEPIYLDVRPLEFQFKADTSIYGCKLPVEGCLFSDRNASKSSFVARMAPFQIGYNYVNNQIIDFVSDEVGNVVLFDQNMIPRNSIDGTWGKNNFVKAYQVMKNFQILPVDTSRSNTEEPLNWNNTTQISLEKTNLIASRLKLAEYFKNEAFATVGITPQRLGDVGISESATGAQAAIDNSYTQTEIVFQKHMNFLMPRVKSMILDAAQYVNSHKNNVRKAYLNKAEENEFFEIEGTRLLLSDFKIYCTTKADTKVLLERLKQLAINNNTSDASIFDLAKVIESNSVSEILATLKDSVDKTQRRLEREQEVQVQMQEQQLQAAAQAEEANKAFEAEQNELDRANDRYKEEIRALGFAKETDVNNNQIPDPLEVARFNAELGKNTEDGLFKQQQEQNKLIAENSKRLSEEKNRKLERDRLKMEIEQKEKDRKLERENMKNDERIARINARNKNKSK